MSATFSKATFWNGVLAIGAGIVSNIFAEWLNFGPVSPFMVAVLCLWLCGIFVVLHWNENYGNQQLEFTISCLEGLRKIFNNDIILLLGTMQSLFESVMYMFVFMWTPILDPGYPPLGIVFACFMICYMAGSSSFDLLTCKKMNAETILQISFGLGLVAMTGCIYTSDPTRNTSSNSLIASYVCFLIFEVAVGLYFPAVSYLRSQAIPEGLRANIMNWFRVPLNVITCCGLIFLHGDRTSTGNQKIFGICSLLLVLAMLSNWYFVKKYKSSKKEAVFNGNAQDI